MDSYILYADIKQIRGICWCNKLNICIYIRMQGTYYRYHEVKMLLNYFRKKHLLKITTLLPCACARGKIEEEPEKITDHTHSQAVIFDLSRVRALHNLTLRRSEPN